MSRVPVRWKTQTSVAPDSSHGFQMVPVGAPVVEVAGGCQSLFGAWQITWGYPFNPLGIEVFTLFDANDAAPIPYPDGCWAFVVQMIGSLCEGDCLDFIAEFNHAGSPGIEGFIMTTSGVPLDVPDCYGAFPRMGNLEQPDGYQVGDTMTLTAYIRGEQFGPAISFACDPAAHAPVWTSWDSFADGLPDTTHTYGAFADGVFRYFEWPGQEFWTNTEHVTTTITQTAGPAVPDATYFVLTRFTCTGWSISFKLGYDYTGTQFSIQASIGGIDIGDPIVYTCEV